MPVNFFSPIFVFYIVVGFFKHICDRITLKYSLLITCQSVALQSVLKINLNSCFTRGDYRRNECVKNAAPNVASSWNDHAFFTISFLPDLFLENSCLIELCFLAPLTLIHFSLCLPFQGAVQGIDRDSDILFFLQKKSQTRLSHITRGTFNLRKTYFYIFTNITVLINVMYFFFFLHKD